MWQFFIFTITTPTLSSTVLKLLQLLSGRLRELCKNFFRVVCATGFYLLHKWKQEELCSYVNYEWTTEMGFSRTTTTRATTTTTTSLEELKREKGSERNDVLPGQKSAFTSIVANVGVGRVPQHRRGTVSEWVDFESGAIPEKMELEPRNNETERENEDIEFYSFLFFITYLFFFKSKEKQNQCKLKFLHFFSISFT